MARVSKDRSDHDDGHRVHSESGSPFDTQLIQEELQRILAAPSFHSSKRCSEFLSFVVKETLEGRHEELKERTLGVSLFGRAPTYDTPGDPIVRVKANEVRKRLAQYYDDHGDGDLRIDLAPGSYVPVFRHADLLQPTDVHLPPPVVSRRRWARRGMASWLALVVAIAAVSFGFWQWRRNSPLDAFWNPALRSDRTPILCVGTSSHVWLLSDRLSAQLSGMLAREAQPTNIAIDPREAIPAENGYFSMGSVTAALGLSAFLSAKGARVQLRMGRPLSLEDFHNHTIVAVGAFSNPWTLQRVSETRFRFKRQSEDGKSWLAISDSQNPKTLWRVQESPFETSSIDFALVTRMFDTTSGTVFVSLAGLNQFGTEAAEEFVTNRSYWDAVVRQAPSDWQSKNLQVVIQTSVVEFRPTPPRVVAVYFW